MQNEKNNEYTKCVRTAIFILKMLGIFPFYPLHEVYNISRVPSIVLTIISVSIYIWITYIEQLRLLEHIGWLYNHHSLLAFIGLFPSACGKTFYLVLSCLTWNKNEQLRNYRNNWSQFQIEMEKLTGTSFEFPKKSKIHVILAIGIISSISLTTLFKTRQAKKRRSTSSTFAYLYLGNGTITILTYWVINNIYTVASAKKITTLVQQSISKGGDVDLRQYVNLWIQLCDLKEEFISSHSILFLLYFVLQVTLLVTASFSSAILYFHFPDKSYSFTFFFATVLGICCLLAFCESANSVSDNVVQKLRKILLSENVNNMDTKSSQMILAFLEIIETKNPEVTLNGFTTVNRSSLLMISQTVIDLLVVLKQFSPENPNIPPGLAAR